MEASGVVLLVTGAGGSFGSVISATGFAKAVQEALTGIAASNQLVILTGFGIAVLFRVALGSGTVASITSMTIMASVAATVSVHPVFIALACLAGGMSIGHVNDSAFWVVSNMSGYTIRGGLKSYTIGGAMVSAMTITTCLVASFFF
jgi:H+/gluconate symporter-like permease